MVYFQTKIQILGKFWMVLKKQVLANVMAQLSVFTVIWYILCMVIRYILGSFGTFLAL
jgi:hypothetical protein